MNINVMSNEDYKKHVLLDQLLHLLSENISKN